MAGHLLLTGGTGLVGRYLVRDLLLEGQPLALLVRGREGESAGQRVDALLAHWEAELGRPLPRPVCLEGDVSLPDLGLSASARRWVAGHCRAVLHNAASLKFVNPDRRHDPWLSNLTGTEHVLEMCRQLGPRELHYVSTAYVCGRREEPVLESELDCGQSFRNDYECSKFEAEQRVREADHLERLTVYRPAIIVGDYRTGFTTTYHALYAYFHFAWLYDRSHEREPDGRLHAPLRLNLTGAERRNLVPVDWVSEVIAHLVLHPEHHGHTYHLTPPKPVTAGEIQKAMADYFNLYGPTFSGPAVLEKNDLNDLERAFYDAVTTYQPYWQTEPRFDCANTRRAAPHLGCPPIDQACLRRLIDFAVRDEWGKRRRKRGARKQPSVLGPGSGGIS